MPAVTSMTWQFLPRLRAIRPLEWLAPLAFVLLLPGFAFAADTGVEFSIEQVRADRALTLFARTAEISVLFPSQEIRDRFANPLVGTYTIDQGLEIMLRGTGLSAVREESGQLIVEITGIPEESLVMSKSPTGSTRRFGSLIAGFVGSIFAASATAPAIAQDSGASRAMLVEVVVTARKRSENLQDVPASVVAFTETIIEEARIRSARDFVNLTPNVSMVETQNIAFSFLNIRGLSQVRNVDPTVAVVVDGVLQTTSLGFSKDLFDLQQIEVLKGPQGALYGRNATGGAINITTRQPTDEFEGYARAGYGNGSSYSFGWAVLVARLQKIHCWAGSLFPIKIPMVGERTRISQRKWIPMRISVFRVSCCGIPVKM